MTISPDKEHPAIPDDIMKAAYDCARGIYLNVDDAGCPYLTTDDIEEIAKSILDERQRCADVVDKFLMTKTSLRVESVVDLKLAILNPTKTGD